MWVDEARHLGWWMITHRFELDDLSSSQLRSFGRATKQRSELMCLMPYTTVGPDTTHHGGVPAPLQG
jgi:hypothetical protein